MVGDKMTKVSLHRMLEKITMSSDREFFISEYVSWLILNIGPRGMSWWLDRDAINGRVYSISFIDSDEAMFFKLIHEL